MVYLIYKDGVEVNRIVADKEFCEKYYSSNGYSYKEERILDSSEQSDLDLAE